MKNVINYNYGFNIIELYNFDNMYYFNSDNNNYYFMIYSRNIEDIKFLLDLNVELKNRRVLTNDIVLNKFNSPITIVDNIPYILIRENIINKQIDINDIFYIQNNTVNIKCNKSLLRNNLILLWENKIDFYERKISDLNSKELIYNSIDYYIGLGENAISYLINNNAKINNYVLSHIRINILRGSLDFYNPINYVIDNRTRDFSEYIKDLFMIDKIDKTLLFTYLNYMNFTRDEYILLISRMLYPSYYFDLIDRIIFNNENEKILESIINRKEEYLDIIRNIYIHANNIRRINIPYIEWIIKKR